MCNYVHLIDEETVTQSRWVFRPRTVPVLCGRGEAVCTSLPLCPALLHLCVLALAAHQHHVWGLSSWGTKPLAELASRPAFYRWHSSAGEQTDACLGELPSETALGDLAAARL